MFERGSTHVIRVRSLINLLFKETFSKHSGKVEAKNLMLIALGEKVYTYLKFSDG